MARLEEDATPQSVNADRLGTASRFRRWLLVEQPGPWGHDALLESGFPVDVGRALKRTGERLGIRVLLIKRRERPPGSRRCYVAYTGTHERRVRAIDVDDPADLLGFDLEAMAYDRFEGVGEAVREPLYLVCTHGKHDQCCARYGAPLFRALEAVPSAWECTHIGGDRFAGNLLFLPHGLYFGRVLPSEAPGIAAAYAEGRIILERYRGRSAYSPPVQAAEHEARARLGVDGVDDLELVNHRRLARRRHLVEFAGSGGARHPVDVRVFDLPPRRLTCKADREGPPRGFEVAVRPVR
jgi:hypothetical protein